MSNVMIKYVFIFAGFIVLYFGCAPTIPAPLNALKKSESKHTFFWPGLYQYQYGLSDKIEIGLDLGIPHYGGNLRFHINQSKRSLNSLQVGIGLRGIITNYMYTYQIDSSKFIRIGPVLSYHWDTKKSDDSDKIYYTSRFGFSLTYGGKYWWITLGYSHPYYKNYCDTGTIISRPGSTSDNKFLLFGNPIFNPILKFGYSF